MVRPNNSVVGVVAVLQHLSFTAFTYRYPLVLALTVFSLTPHPSNSLSLTSGLLSTLRKLGTLGKYSERAGAAVSRTARQRVAQRSNGRNSHPSFSPCLWLPIVGAGWHPSGVLRTSWRKGPPSPKGGKGRPSETSPSGNVLGGRKIVPPFERGLL